MGIDLCVGLGCAPKAHLGQGDIGAGTEVILEMLKARSRADAIEQECLRTGANPSAVRINVVTRLPTGDRTEAVTLADLRARAEPVNALGHHCQSCPARVFDHAYGCFGYANYPIPRAAEEWLMSALRPAHELGGIVCLQALADFGWDGEPVRHMRANGFFESPQAVMRDLGGSWVSSDAILQAFLAVGTLQPMHCAIALSWFGAVIDGQWLQGRDKSDIGPLLSVPASERARRVAFALPPPPAHAVHLATLLAMAQRAWVTEQPLLIST